MKKTGMILGTMVLAALLASPALAHGPGWGKGGGMRSGWGMGPGCAWGSPQEDGTEQLTKLGELRQNFWNETAGTRSELWGKKAELRALLANPEPDAEKARALQKEMLQLKNTLAEKRLEMALEARKIAPEGGYGPGCAGGSGGPMMGRRGPMMGGWGRHRGGYGAGMDYGQGPMMGGWGGHMGGYGAGKGYGPGGCGY